MTTILTTAERIAKNRAIISAWIDDAQHDGQSAAEVAYERVTLRALLRVAHGPDAETARRMARWENDRITADTDAADRDEILACAGTLLRLADKLY